MRCLLPAAVCLATLLSSCQQAQHRLARGSQWLGRPIVAGTKNLASAAATGSRAVAAATASGSRKWASATLTGAKSLAAGATRLVTFGSAARPVPPSPLASPPEPNLPTPFRFPTSGLLVSDAELGPDPTRLQATALTLAGGWVLQGREVAYRLQPGADDPAALRVRGQPATATLSPEAADPTQASAQEIHYHASHQVLTLRGQALLSSGGTRVAATSPSTLLKIHLPSGAISIEGPASWGQ